MSVKDYEKEIEELRKEIRLLKEMDEIIIWRISQALNYVEIDFPSKVEEYLMGGHDDKRLLKSNTSSFKPKSFEDTTD